MVKFCKEPSLKSDHFKMSKVKSAGDMVTSLILLTGVSALVTTFYDWIFDVESIKVINQFALGVHLFVQTLIVSVVLAVAASLLLLPIERRFQSEVFYHNFRVKALVNIPFFILFAMMVNKLFDGTGSFNFELNDPRLWVGVFCGVSMLILVIKLLYKPLVEYFSGAYSKRLSHIVTIVCVLLIGQMPS